MKEIYLIRHSGPFVEFDNYSDFQNVIWDDYNRNMLLSVEGEKKSESLANNVELTNIDEIYCSDSARAIGTGKYIAERNNLKIKLDSRINERYFGFKTWNEVEDDFTQKSFNDKNFKYKNGESLNDLDKRFSSFLKEIIHNENKKTVIVFHGIILLSYLISIGKSEKYDGTKFVISFNGKNILNGFPSSPGVFKLIIKENKIFDIEAFN